MELTLQPPVAANGLDRRILDNLFAILKSWSEEMDAFRYLMFARRLVAAEYGRHDAVAWAIDWHDSIAEEEREAEAAKREAMEQKASRDAKDREAFLAGRCGNPHYQAYLDTVENPAGITHHAEYLCWISNLAGEHGRTPGLKDLPHAARVALWQKLLIAKRDANLAPRLKGQPTRLPFERS